MGYMWHFKGYSMGPVERILRQSQSGIGSTCEVLPLKKHMEQWMSELCDMWYILHKEPV